MKWPPGWLFVCVCVQDDRGLSPWSLCPPVLDKVTQRGRVGRQTGLALHCLLLVCWNNHCPVTLGTGPVFLYHVELYMLLRVIIALHIALHIYYMLHYTLYYTLYITLHYTLHYSANSAERHVVTTRCTY